MKKYIVTFLISLVIIATGGIVILFKSINFNQNCKGYLERASNATNVETALSEIKKATSYLEAEGLTTGYTSVIYRTPDEDISYWYNNLKSAEKELEKVNDKTTALEKSNILLKLRETLVEEGKNGQNIIVPQGLPVYPNNLLFGLWIILPGLVLFIVYGILRIKLD